MYQVTKVRYHSNEDNDILKIGIFGIFKLDSGYCFPFHW